MEEPCRNWFNTHPDCLLSIQLKPSKSDLCLFLRDQKSRKDFVASWLVELFYCSDYNSFYENFEKPPVTPNLISEVDDLIMQFRREKSSLKTF